MIKLFFLTLTACSLFFITSISAQEDDSQSPSENLTLKEFACQASTPKTFQGCLDEAKQIGVPLIKIVAPIICSSAQECSFKLYGSTSSFTISSSSPENKFIRQNDFSYTLLTIENSSNFNLKSLLFEDRGSTGCPTATICPAAVSISNSSSTTLDDLSFSFTRGTSLQVINSRSINISNSSFKNSYKTGLELSGQGYTNAIKIENNLFDNNAGSGLILQAQSINQSSISNNQFINNHSRGSYTNCTFPCIGSQIKIQGPSSNLSISANTISGGVNTFFDTVGLYASGIQIGGQNINSLTLSCNEITGNRGSGIVQSGPFSGISKILITENKIFGNGLNLNIPTTVADQNNCYTKDCQLACAKP